MTKNILRGLKKAGEDQGFVAFDPIAFVQDPGYGYDHVYLFLIRFTHDKDYGLCIYDHRRGTFIEEPSDLEDYNTTLEAIKQKYYFKNIKN